jgi:hypothetical protein
MTHVSEEDLVLHYYAEAGGTTGIERHLDECAACRELYGGLQRTLNLVDGLPVPERGAAYGAEVWARLAPRMAPRRRFRLALTPAWRWTMAAATSLALLAAAFLAGRFQERLQHPAGMAADTHVRERVLLVAVGDYLDRSQMVLIELANASGPQDITATQERAQDLLSETRLYRQTAATTGDASIGGFLDELERVLLDVTHGPSRLSAADVEALRHKLEAEGILFKIRVVNSQVRDRQRPAGPKGFRQAL